MSGKYDAMHRAERAAWKPIVDAGQAYCSEPRCVIVERGGSRWIPPGARWHLSHDATGTRWIGPSHGPCNEAESARRNNPKRARRRRSWVL